MPETFYTKGTVKSLKVESAGQISFRISPTPNFQFKEGKQQYLIILPKCEKTPDDERKEIKNKCACLVPDSPEFPFGTKILLALGLLSAKTSCLLCHFTFEKDCNAEPGVDRFLLTALEIGIKE